MSRVVELLSFLPKGATTKRDLDERSSEMALSVKDFGATGNGITDDTASIQACLDAAFGSATSPHGQSAELNKAVFFPAGMYKVSGNPALKVTGVKGGRIFGAGMWTSVVTSATPASILFTLNGFGFSSIQDMGFNNLGSGACITLDFNWDNVAPQGSQNSSFTTCFFGQNNADSGSIVVALGRDGYQTDTSTFINCYVSGANGGAGYKTLNSNALGIVLVGGQILGCTTGVSCPAGTVSGIFNTYFANRIHSTDYDIEVQGGATDCYSVQGCRSESHNFFRSTTPTANINLTGCSLNGELLGHFANAGGPVHMSNCWSKMGDVVIGGGGANTGQVTIENSVFMRWDALTIGNSNGIADIRNSTLGPTPHGLCRTILHQRIGLNTIRTFDIEAANVSTDKNFLYENFLNPTAQNGIINNLPTTQAISPTFTVATPAVVTFPSVTWFRGGEALAFTLSTTGAMPTGITSGRTYFVTKDALTNTPGTQFSCHLSDTQANALSGTSNVNVTVAGSGDISSWSVRRWAVGDIVLNTGVAAAGSPGWICTTAGWASTVNAGETQAVFKALANVAA